MRAGPSTCARDLAPVAYRAVALAVVLVAACLLVTQIVTVLLAVLMTAILAVALEASTSRLERLGVPRWIGALLTILAGLTALAGLLALVVPRLLSEVESFFHQVPGVLADLQHRLHDLTGLTPAEINHRAQAVVDRFAKHPLNLLDPITTIGVGIAGLIGAAAVMLVTAYYVAVRPDPIVRALVRLVPPPHRERARIVLRRLREAWLGWLQGVLADMLVTGTLVYLGLTIIGLPYALVFAVLAGLVVVVPIFGTIAGGLAPTLFALTQSPGRAVLVIVVYVIAMEVEGNVIIPLVMARTVHIHPAAVAIGVVVVGALLGLVGLAVAVPVLSLVFILVEELWILPQERKHERRPLIDVRSRSGGFGARLRRAPAAPEPPRGNRPAHGGESDDDEAGDGGRRVQRAERPTQRGVSEHAWRAP